MRILIVTDAWHPQVNGVVRTLNMVAQAARLQGAEVEFLTPEPFRSIAMPTYPDLRLALPLPGQVARHIRAAKPDAIHIATEGPIGHLARRYCLKNGLPFTTSFHTRFPEYVSARVPVPESWVWAWLRRFHAPSSAVMAATPALMQELSERGFGNVVLWPRGVDAELFHPQDDADLDLKRPVFLSVGRVAVEKNIEAFLSLNLPGTKVVVGDGPARAMLEKKFPDTVFLGAKFGTELARIYAASDVFVFPSHTDTFGLVLLEALACGVPVAAFPVQGPRDVLGDAPVAVLSDDLRKACLHALNVSREACREFAVSRSWAASARAFLDNVESARMPARPTSRAARRRAERASEESRKAQDSLVVDQPAAPRLLDAAH